jgi:two-component system LytT family response regulator
MIRTLIVDDEAFARERLRELLSAVAGVEVAGEAANGEEALERIARLQPDLVLLDIQMPGPNGLEVAASLPRPRPRIIFCTAYEKYAVDAFEVHAVDYLLKPVNRIRLAHAIDRVREQPAVQAEAGVDRLTRTMLDRRPRLLARCADRIHIIPQTDVVYLSSDGGLTRAHTKERQYVLEPTLNDLEELVDPAMFFRISRSAIVNLDVVAEVHLLVGGTADVALKSGARLEVSRRRLKDLLDRLGS